MNEEKLEEYLETVINNSLADYAYELYLNIKSTMRKNGFIVDIPDACFSYDSFMYCFDRGQHYFECEIFINGVVEFFYKNRATSELWGEDSWVENKLSKDVIEKLKIFSVSA